MTTETIKKLNKLEKEVYTLKTLVSQLVPLDKEGDYKKPFVNHLRKVSKEKPVATYTGKNSLRTLLR